MLIEESVLVQKRNAREVGCGDFSHLFHEKRLAPDRHTGEAGSSNRVHITQPDVLVVSQADLSVCAFTSWWKYRTIRT